MKILIISAVFPPEPVVSASISFDLATELSHDNDVTVLCPPPTRPMGFKLNGMVPAAGEWKFKRLEMNSYTFPASAIVGRFRESYSFGKHCATYIKANLKTIDLIYFNAWPLCAQFIIAHTAKKLGIPYVVHVQDIYPETIFNPSKFVLKVPFFIFLQFDKYVLKNAKSVVTISEHMSGYVKRTRQIASNLKIVYNWPNQPPILYNQLHAKASLKFIFMFLGSLSPTAGIDILINGFCDANLPGAQLILAGAGSDKERLEKIASRFPGQDIQFVDAPKEMVPSLQQSADVLLLSLKSGSAKYALPSKLTSYLYAQKPVIACVDPGSSVGEIIDQAGCGWICDVNDPKEIAGIFLSATKTTNEMRNQMGRKGKDFAERWLSKSVNLSRLKNIILADQ